MVDALQDACATFKLTFLLKQGAANKSDPGRLPHAGPAALCRLAEMLGVVPWPYVLRRSVAVAGCLCVLMTTLPETGAGDSLNHFTPYRTGGFSYLQARLAIRRIAYQPLLPCICQHVFGCVNTSTLCKPGLRAAQM
jgi:hypothetical protein